MSPRFPCFVLIALSCAACECREVMLERHAPDDVRFTVSGMHSEPARPDTEQPATAPGDIWGEGLYAIDIDEDGRARARLEFGSGDLAFMVGDDADAPPALTGRAGDDPLAIAIVFEQGAAPAPGDTRTLRRSDFDGATLHVAIGDALYVDDTPDLTLAFDLATGATAIDGGGVLRRLDAAGAERPYTLAGEGITPIDCAYHPLGEGGGSTWMPPDGQMDVCRALTAAAERMPATPETPALPWNPDAPETETVCGF